MSPPKVCIGNINPGQLSVGFVVSAWESNNAGLVSHAIFHPNGPYLDMGRNIVVRKFLTETDDDYLLFIDSDIKWSVDDLNHLYDRLSPDHVIGGYYLNPYLEGINPVVYEWQRPDVDSDWLLRSITTDDLLSRADIDGIAMCTCIGTGFMAIPRTILEIIGAKYVQPCEYFAQP